MFAITIATLAMSAVTQPPGVLEINGLVSKVANLRLYYWADNPIYPHLGDAIHGEIGLTNIAPPHIPAGTSSGNFAIQIGPWLMDGFGGCGPDSGPALSYCNLTRLNQPTIHNRDGIFWGILFPDLGNGEIWVPYDGSIDPENDNCKWGGSCGDYPIEVQFTATRRIIGDSNLDGQFDSSDLVTVFIAGEYEDEIVGNSRFITGDWNVDREFDSADMVVAFQAGEYEQPAAAAVIPEPSGLLLILLGSILLIRASRD